MKESRRRQESGLSPAYHEIVPGGSEYVYSIDPQRMGEHFAMLAALPGMRGAEPSPRVTFDDGHISHFQYAFPLLQEHGLRGVFFAVAGRIEQRRDCMTWGQLRELVSAKQEVQSHGLSHVALTRCSEVELAREVQVSRTALEQKLGTAVNAISIPYGRWDRRVLEACANAGYTRIYTSDPRSPFRFQDRVEVQGRFSVLRSTGVDQLRRIVLGDRKSLRALAVKHQCKLLIRAVIGDRVYHRLWQILGSRESIEDMTGERESKVEQR